jgi:hypothetical protein
MLTDTGELSTKVDVYSYGVVLMKIVTGRKVIDNPLPQKDKLLVPIFRTNFLDKEKFRNIVDPTLELNGEDWNSLLEVAQLAYHCTAEEPEQRPGIHTCVGPYPKWWISGILQQLALTRVSQVAWD